MNWPAQQRPGPRCLTPPTRPVRWPAGTRSSAPRRARPSVSGYLGHQPSAAELVSLYLKPGELLVCREPCAVTTVLGSCIAVTMFNAELGLAAICHAMLPAPGQGHGHRDCSPEPFKYVKCAIPEMVSLFKRAGVPPAAVEVKLFGGATCMGRHRERDCPKCVGPANVRMARLLLQEHHLTIRASNVGGHHGRKLFFNTWTGEVLHKHLAAPATLL